MKECTVAFTVNTQVVQALHRRIDVDGEEADSARRDRVGDEERRSGEDRRVRVRGT